MIGVNPLFQRRGFGRKMIESKLFDCDKIKMRCYIETSDLTNINYYEKFGFSLINEYNIQDIKVFCLLREPNPATVFEE